MISTAVRISPSSSSVGSSCAANAATGYHDDRLMCRAIGLYVSSTMPIPREVKDNSIDNRFRFGGGNWLNESQF